MRILIAPDKFKGVLGAREVAEHIAAGLRAGLPKCEIDIVPMADGGEGTAEVLRDALKGEWRECAAHDPLGRVITARYAWIERRKLAVMEMSEAAGMRRLHPNEYDVDRASTFGVGKMILAASAAGANEIIVGLGGSATNDGGFGMARAMGFRFLAGERELNGKVSELRELSRIVAPHERVRAKMIAAVDVRNPLLGGNGATRIFGPQKGATAKEIPVLEASLSKLAEVAADQLARDFRNTPGGGAAGGLGFGLMTFCSADLRSGFDIVAEALDLPTRIKAADVVITGEGKLDRQTREGKTPAGVARLAHSLGKKVYALVGYAGPEAESDSLFDGVWAASSSDKLDAEAVARAGEMLEARAKQIAPEIGGGLELR